MMRILLPEHIDCMKDKRKKEVAWALKNLSHAIYVKDEKTAHEICAKYNLRVLDGVTVCSNVD